MLVLGLVRKLGGGWAGDGALPFSFLYYVLSQIINYLLGACSLISKIQYPEMRLAKHQEKFSDVEVKRELGKRSGVTHFSCPLGS